MKKRLIIFLFAAFMPFFAVAEEGMWLVHSFRSTISKEMKKAGFKVKDADFYNEAAPALCDAVVSVDGGMGTGSMISPEGLMITNHHVAYSDICALSSPDCNLLEEGFWATGKKDELPVPGKTVTFLRMVVDVTEEYKELEKEMIAELGRPAAKRQVSILEKRYGEKTGLEAACYSFFRGDFHLMMLYETYRDVRLVGAPPERIGSFGGETDNWGWPQHKGDFAIYRVYAGRDGKPAEYSAENVPLKPEKYLKISTGGVHDGDFAMVIGFPGITHRYSSSAKIYEKANVTNPIVYSCRRARLDVIREHMDADPDVRLIYSDRYTSTANYMDYARWEARCVNRYDVPAIRAAEESKVKEWINSDAERTGIYGDVVDRLAAGYKSRAEAQRDLTYFRETWFYNQSVAMNVGGHVNRIVNRRKDQHDSLSLSTCRELQNEIRYFNREPYDGATDRDLLGNAMRMFTRNVDRSFWGDELSAYYDRFGGDTDAMTDHVYDTSFCASREKFTEYFSVNRSVGEIRSDPLVALNNSVSYPIFAEALAVAEKRAGSDVGEDERLYYQALYEYRKDKGILQYPDANSTMRVTYGKVGPVKPYDGVHYDSRSTVDGYTEKYDPSDHDFRVDGKMRTLIADKDWGRWGEKGTLYVNFLTDNDITGGNSGSPVLNARGDLIGLAFDGNRESMAGDVYYHPTLNKSVSVDIRFVLWVVDKYAGATSLIEEMTLVK